MEKRLSSVESPFVSVGFNENEEIKNPTNKEVVNGIGIEDMLVFKRLREDGYEIIPSCFFGKGDFSDIFIFNIDIKNEKTGKIVDSSDIKDFLRSSYDYKVDEVWKLFSKLAFKTFIKEKGLKDYMPFTSYFNSKLGSYVVQFYDRIKEKSSDNIKLAYKFLRKAENQQQDLEGLDSLKIQLIQEINKNYNSFLNFRSDYDGTSQLSEFFLIDDILRDALEIIEKAITEKINETE